MIVAHKPDVNPDDYCYDTGLKFGSAAGKYLLEKILMRQAGFLPDAVDNKQAYKETAKHNTFSNTKEILRRKKQNKELNNDLTHITSDQWVLPEDLRKAFHKDLPAWLLGLDADTTRTLVQMSHGGDYFSIHSDSKRCSSMFMLLQGQEQETHWYRNTEAFEILNPARIPDHDKIEHVVTAVIRPYRWYVFNHAAWHGVSGFVDGGARVHVSLDFKKLSAQEVVKVVKANTPLARSGPC
tara:strand:- start:281 stop:997 length:717 start_codon:yes stop_codon:yes gene_type:complete